MQTEMESFFDSKISISICVLYTLCTEMENLGKVWLLEKFHFQLTIFFK